LILLPLLVVKEKPLQITSKDFLLSYYPINDITKTQKHQRELHKHETTSHKQKIMQTTEATDLNRRHGNVLYLQHYQNCCLQNDRQITPKMQQKYKPNKLLNIY